MRHHQVNAAIQFRACCAKPSTDRAYCGIRKPAKGIGTAVSLETPTFPPHLIVFANHAFVDMMQQSSKHLKVASPLLCMLWCVALIQTVSQGRPLRMMFGPSTSTVELMRLALHIQDHSVLEELGLIVYNGKEVPIQATMSCQPLKAWTGQFNCFLLSFKCDDTPPSQPLLNHWRNKNKFATSERAFQFELSQVLKSCRMLNTLQPDAR